MKFLLIAMALPVFAAADDLRLTIHMVAMEPAKLTELMSGADEPSIDIARAMVKDGEARLFNTILLRLQRGTKARLSSGGEVIFPSEYEPPSLPNGNEEEISRRMDGWIKAYPFMPIQGAWTGEFEKRAVGEFLELQAQDEGKVSWSLHLTRHVGETVYLERQDMESGKFQYRFSTIESLKMNGNMAPGVWHCAGVMGIPGNGGSPGEKIVVFAKNTELVMPD